MEVREIKKTIKLTKQLSIAEMMLFNVFFIGIQGFVLTSFAIYFNCSPLILAIISTSPVTAQMLQIFTMSIYKILKTRKRILIIMSSISRLSFLLIPIAIIMNWRNPYLLLCIILVYSIFGAFAGNVWVATIKTIITEKERGSFFGLRNVFGSLATMIFIYLYGYILKNYSDKTGLLIVSIIMAVSAIITIFLLANHYIPDLEEESKTKVSILEPLKSPNFKKFLIFVFYWVLSVELAKPFFSYYQIQILNIDKEFLGILSVVTGIISMLIFIGVGKLADNFGNKQILSTGLFLSTYAFILFLFISPSNYIMVLILESILSSFAWAAITIAFFNLLLEVAQKPTEAYSGLYAIIVGISGLLASIIGGFLGNILQDKSFVLFGETYHGLKIIFLLGFLLRIMAILHLTNVDAYLKPLKYSGFLNIASILSRRNSFHIVSHVKGHLGKNKK